MQRHEFEHILRAAGAVTNEKEFIVIGSQAILGAVNNPPTELLLSQELDIFSPVNEEKSDLIDGSIGEMSPFHAEFGYYAHGVSEKTAVLPKAWKSRLIKVHNSNTGGVTGLCLSLADLVISKILANRPRDKDFVMEVFKYALLHIADVENLLDEMHSEEKKKVESFIARYLA